MSSSPFVPNIRGLNEALEYVDKEQVVPLAIICVRLDRDGIKPVVLDCSPSASDEIVRVATLNSVLLAVAAKVRG